MHLKLKICGLKHEDNITDVLTLNPDYIGLIFYPKSPRFIGNLSDEFISTINPVKKIGVFVDALFLEIKDAVERYQLEGVQLHGSESVDFCYSVKNLGVEVIKSFGIGNGFNWDALKPYEPSVDFFLFDTASNQYGGSGKAFNWNILKFYGLNKPYFLSGGIGPENISKVMLMDDKRLYAVDVNSKFEITPGFKNIALLRKFFEAK